ncbi:MAG: hypothetical protein HQL84_09990 [Magnetococcales bacterium]|nr:hypothetical protein [Magnetococcales bacterium]MBF0150361.1 hypothetical protein [Magnetococcales bacterium]MBF0632155.1 hypothetical protein [Magnetococcales bacterium]
MSYSDPDFQVRREHCAGEAGGAATTEYARFASFQKARLKKVHVVVTTAGTATDHGFDLYSGTSSIGSITLGTNAAGNAASSAALNATMNAMGRFSVKSKADATGKAVVVYEYEVTPDAVQSA